MKHILFIATALIALTSAGNAHPHGPYRSCRGVLTKDAHDDIYLLKADRPNSWCDADIVVKYVGPDAINRILSVCKIDGRCHIKGRLSGGRRIVWTTIIEVTRP